MGRRNDEYVTHIADLLAPLGPIHWRAMFGGYGIYCGDLFFALIIDEVLYLKADEQSRGQFEAEGLPPFTYEKQGGRAVSVGYFQAPDLIFDDEEALRHWGNLALAAALRARRPAAGSPTTPRKTSKTGATRQAAGKKSQHGKA